MANHHPTANLLACKAKTCPWEVDFDPETHRLPLPCPTCGGQTQVRCGARLRGRPDTRCMKWAKIGGRCRLHGRNARKGSEVGTFKHGERSKYNPKRYIPPRYREVYEHAQTDPVAQREMTHQLSMMAGMEDEAAKRVGTGESGAAWRELQARGREVGSQIQELRRLQASGENPQRRGELLTEIFAKVEGELLPTIDQGLGEEHAREELTTLYTKRARIMRVQQQGEDTVPRAVLSTFQAFFAALMGKYLTDQAARSRMIAELREAELPGWEAAGLSRYAGARQIEAGNGHGVIDVGPGPATVD